jgi:hypothetical protein
MQKEPWVVGLQQRHPFEFVSIEYFEEEGDALHFADLYAYGHGGIQLSKRRWRLADDELLVVQRHVL